MRSALVVGLAGPVLTVEEAAFLGRTRPAGIIIFARNVTDKEQLAALIADAVSAIGSADVLVLVDQEGGRVRRLHPPEWRDLPAAACYGKVFGDNPEAALASALAVARITAHDLRSIGINTNCVPCADLMFNGADAIIGDRAYGSDVETVVALAGAAAAGHFEGGVLPILKHIPGHGRAGVDSHFALPIVDAELADLDATDFATFRALAGLPAAMTAHVVYTAIDPDNPATTSRIVIDRVVRGTIGFEGLLFSDDLSMQALSGSLSERATAAVAAGCDIALHCNGDLDEMHAVAGAVPQIDGAAWDRFQICLDVVKVVPGNPSPAVVAAAEKALMQLGAA